MPDTTATITVQAVDDASQKLQAITQTFENMTRESQTLNQMVGDTSLRMDGLGNIIPRVTQATDDSAASMGQASVATQAWGTALGVLGVQSVEAVVMKVIQLGVESFKLSAQMEAMERRAQAIFGTSFPQVQASAARLGEEFGRNTEQMLQFETGFGTVLSGMNVAPDKIDGMSEALTTLTVKLGRAFAVPDDEMFQKINRGIEGNIRALKDYGINMDTKALKDFANASHIDVSVKSMNDEQLAMLRTMYLLEKTGPLQDAGTKGQDDAAESLKKLGAEWMTFEENLGSWVSVILPPVLAGFDFLVGKVEALGQGVVRVGMLLADTKVTGMGDVNGDLTKNYAAAGFREKNDELSASYKKNQGAVEALAATHKEVYGPQFDKNYEQAKKLADGINAIGDTSGSGGNKAARALDQIKSSMEALGQTYDTESQHIKDAVTQLETAHRDKMDSMDEQILNAVKAVNELNRVYAKAVEDMNSQRFDKVATEMQKVQDLKDKLADAATKSGGLQADQIVTVMANRSDKDRDTISAKDAKQFNLSGADVTQLNDYIKLQKEQAALDKELKDHPEEKAAKSEQGENSFAKEMEQMDKKKQDLKATHDVQTQAHYDTINQLEQKEQKEVESYNVAREQYRTAQVAMETFHDSYVKSLANMAKVTKEQVKDMKQSLNELKQTLSSIKPDAARGVSAREAAVDTAINQTGSRPNPSSVVINMGGVTVRSQADIDQLLQEFTRRVQLEQARSN